MFDKLARHGTLRRVDAGNEAFAELHLPVGSDDDLAGQGGNKQLKRAFFLAASASPHTSRPSLGGPQ